MELIFIHAADTELPPDLTEDGNVSFTPISESEDDDLALFSIG